MKLWDFAYLQKDWLSYVAEYAIKENWGANHDYLQTYCQNNFEIAHNQGLILIDPEERFSIWRVGHLVSPDGVPIYVYFTKNQREGRQPFFLARVIATRNLVIRYRASRNAEEERITINHPPIEPRYEIPEYHPQHYIEYNWDHYLVEHKSRMDEQLPGVDNERVKYLSIFGAVRL